MLKKIYRIDYFRPIVVIVVVVVVVVVLTKISILPTEAQKLFFGPIVRNSIALFL